MSLSTTAPPTGNQLQPTYLTVPAGAGTGTIPPVQLPIGASGSITVINLSKLVQLNLCNDNLFSVGQTFPLPVYISLPFTAVTGLWAQNTTVIDGTILVLQGIVPVNLPALSYLLLAVQFNAASGTLTYAPYSTASLSGYSFSSVPVTASTLSFKITSLPYPPPSAYTAGGNAITGLTCMAVNNGTVLLGITGSTTVQYSSNSGVTMSTQTLPVALTVTGPTYSALQWLNGFFWFYGTAGSLYRSTTGTTGSWTLVYTLTGGSAISLIWDGTYFIITSSTAAACAFSTTGASGSWSVWTSPTTSMMIAYLSGVYVGIQYNTAATVTSFINNTIFTSAWSAGGAIPSTTYGILLASGISGFYANQNGGTTSATSPTGVTWTTTTGLGGGNDTASLYYNSLLLINATSPCSYFTSSTTVANFTTPASGSGYMIRQDMITNNVIIYNKLTPFTVYSAVSTSAPATTVELIGQTSGNNYGSFTLANATTGSYSLNVLPTVDTSYYLVNTLPTTTPGWILKDATGDITVNSNYTIGAQSPATNVIEITYQIFSAQPNQVATITDQTGNKIGTINLNQPAGTYTAFISYQGTGSSYTVSGAGLPSLTLTNYQWKIYYASAHN